MTTEQIANQLVELCRVGKYEEAYQQLFDPQIVSQEPEGSVLDKTVGMEALAQKGEQWNSMLETVHSSEVSDPIVAENYFACTMKTVVTMKGAAEQSSMEEICVYEVRDGKIVKEQFFYTVGVPQGTP